MKKTGKKALSAMSSFIQKSTRVYTVWSLFIAKQKNGEQIKASSLLNPSNIGCRPFRWGRCRILVILYSVNTDKRPTSSKLCKNNKVHTLNKNIGKLALWLSDDATHFRVNIFKKKKVLSSDALLQANIRDSLFLLGKANTLSLFF